MALTISQFTPNPNKAESIRNHLITCELYRNIITVAAVIFKGQEIGDIKTGIDQLKVLQPVSKELFSGALKHCNMNFIEKAIPQILEDVNEIAFHKILNQPHYLETIMQSHDKFCARFEHLPLSSHTMRCLISLRAAVDNPDLAHIHFDSLKDHIQLLYTTVTELESLVLETMIANDSLFALLAPIQSFMSHPYMIDPDVYECMKAILNHCSTVFYFKENPDLLEKSEVNTDRDIHLNLDSYKKQPKVFVQTVCFLKGLAIK